MVKMTKSSGNVFEDLGFDALESENLRLRAQLMRELETLIHNQRLTQSDAAELLGIQQSRVSDLVRLEIKKTTARVLKLIFFICPIMKNFNFVGCLNFILKVIIQCPVHS